jgi:hypothetical protein
MSRQKRIMIVLLVAFILVSAAPATYAQDMPDIPFSEIPARLLPQPDTMLWDILLYLIFFMALITSLLVPDKQMLPTLVITLVMGMVVINKLHIFGPGHFATLVLNAGIFVLPLIVAGMVRARMGTPKAMAPAALTGILGGIYFFLFWAMEQRSIVG